MSVPNVNAVKTIDAINNNPHIIKIILHNILRESIALLISNISKDLFKKDFNTTLKFDPTIKAVIIINTENNDM